MIKLSHNIQDTITLLKRIRKDIINKDSISFLHSRAELLKGVNSTRRLLHKKFINKYFNNENILELFGRRQSKQLKADELRDMSIDKLIREVNKRNG
jgi:hypothetical protein